MCNVLRNVNFVVFFCFSIFLSVPCCCDHHFVSKQSVIRINVECCVCTTGETYIHNTPHWYKKLQEYLNYTLRHYERSKHCI